MFTENTFNKEFTIVEILFSIFKNSIYKLVNFVGELAPRKGLARRARARAAPKRVERLASLQLKPTHQLGNISDLNYLNQICI